MKIPQRRLFLNNPSHLGKKIPARRIIAEQIIDSQPDQREVKSAQQIIFRLVITGLLLCIKAVPVQTSSAFGPAFQTQAHARIFHVVARDKRIFAAELKIPVFSVFFQNIVEVVPQHDSGHADQINIMTAENKIAVFNAVFISVSEIIKVFAGVFLPVLDKHRKCEFYPASILCIGDFFVGF